LFNDDDNDILDSDDENLNSKEQSSVIKKPPLKLVIKRLQHPTISNAIKYKLQTVDTSVPIIT
jgi:hypothetical protein